MGETWIFLCQWGLGGPKQIYMGSPQIPKEIDELYKPKPKLTPPKNFKKTKTKNTHINLYGDLVPKKKNYEFFKPKLKSS